MATVRPPRNGPMHRQRISEKNFGSRSWPAFLSDCCPVTGRADVINPTTIVTIPKMSHFPAAANRIRPVIGRLPEAGEDTPPVESWQFAALASGGSTPEKPVL